MRLRGPGQQARTGTAAGDRRRRRASPLAAPPDPPQRAMKESTMPFGLQHTIKTPAPDSLPEGAAYSAAAQVTMCGEVALMSDPDILARRGSTWGESTQGQNDAFTW